MSSSEQSSQSWFKHFYEELKRRRVIRVATIYVIVFWPVIQIADILSPALALPVTTMRYLLIAFTGGFPLALVLAWLFDLNKSGVVRAGEASEASRGQTFFGRGTELTIITLLILVIAILFYAQTQKGFYSSDGAVKADTTDAAVANEVHSIAVLPLVTFSQSSEDNYFADGLTEELLNVLSRIKSLRVAARTSSFAYKNVNKNVSEIGAELNVDYILEGSVRRNDVDNTIRITAQLIDVKSGAHLWSRTFDKQYRDIFKIQDEISFAVVSELKVSLIGEDESRLQSRHSVNPQTLVAHSMGQTELSKRTRVGLINAIKFFNEAIESDPAHAESYVGLADAHSLLSEYAGEAAASHLKAAHIAVEQAMKLDDNLGSALASRGLIKSLEGNIPGAQEDLQKAMSLNPSYAMAYMWYGGLLNDPEDRTRNFKKAFDLDPRSPVTGFNLAREYLLAGLEGESMQVFSQIVEADPFYPGAYLLIAQINEFRGRLGEAIKYYKKVYELENNGPVALELAELYVDLGYFEKADDWMQKARQDPSVKLNIGIKWLELGAMVAKGKVDEARELLRSLALSDLENYQSYFHGIQAAYHLEDYTRILELYDKLIEEKPAQGFNMSERFIEIKLAVAYSYQKTGKPAEAQKFLSELEIQLDEMVANHQRVNPDLWFTKSRIQALEGNQQMALIYLQRAIDEGWRQYWRPYVDPALVSVLLLDNFKSMMAGLEAKLDLIREQIAFEEGVESDWQG